jgi:lysyl-tRNA synthetase class 2
VSLAEVRRLHDAKDADTLAAEDVRLAVVGRVMGVRSFGKLVFLTLVQDGAELQVTLRKQELPAEVFALGRELDVADFVRAEGVLWRTQKGELSVDARALDVLAKSLRPLPEKWHGLVDVEARYRQRYLDLLTNPRARELAHTRSRAVRALRTFLDGRGFLEVETPVLQPLYGGATARPFVTHYNVYEQDVYLRISNELYLKRLVIGGLDRVYEIGRDFRNEGVSRKRNPEFTMMECYQAYADYRDMMALTEAMLRHVVTEVTGGTRLVYRSEEIEFGTPFARRRLPDAIRDATGIDVLAARDLASLRDAARRAGLDPGDAPTWGQLVDALFSEHVEPKLIQPTFLTDYPVELSPLAKRSPDDPRLVERFEIFVAGMELGNAFSELNDPDDQRVRFEEQGGARAAGDEEAQPLDEEFLLALEHGMPPTGGLGIGVDRVVMLIADVPHLREVLLFPYMRPERS